MALEPVLKSAAQVDWARVRARDGHQTSGTSRSAEFFPSARLVESEQLALFPLEILLRSLTRNEETRLWQWTHRWPDDLRTRFVAAGCMAGTRSIKPTPVSAENFRFKG